MSKPDLFGFLGQLQAGYPLAYDDLADEDKKSFSPLVIQRWLSGGCSADQVLTIAGIGNRFIYSLRKHPELLFKVIAASCLEETPRHQWIKGPARKQRACTSAEKLVASTLGCSTAEAREHLQILTGRDIITLAEESGFQPDEMKKLKEELK